MANQIKGPHKVGQTLESLDNNEEIVEMGNPNKGYMVLMGKLDWQKNNRGFYQLSHPLFET